MKDGYRYKDGKIIVSDYNSYNLITKSSGKTYTTVNLIGMLTDLDHLKGKAGLSQEVNDMIENNRVAFRAEWFGYIENCNS